MVSQEKGQVIKESIRRLLELDISEAEILASLQSVGVDETTARTLLKETKDEASGKSPKRQFPQQGQAFVQQGQNQQWQPQRPQGPPAQQGWQSQQGQREVQVPQGQQGQQRPKGKQEPAPSNADAADNRGVVSDDFYKLSEDESEESLKTPVIMKPINNPHYSKSGQGQRLPEKVLSEEEGLTTLWEKGILATVSARLAEMKQIRDNLDSVLDKKIVERVDLASKKVEVILDSQRTLFYSKVDAHLDAKADQLKRVLESRAKQLEDANAKVLEGLSKISAEKKFNAELLATIDQKLVDIDAIRSQAVSETSHSMLTMESKFNSFMEESSRKRDELEDRIKNSLQLEATVSEGMVANAKQSIEAMRIEKEQELTKRVESKVRELDELTKMVDAKGVTQKFMQLGELEQRLAKKEKEIDLKLSRLSSENERLLGQAVAGLKKEFEGFKKEVEKVGTGRLEVIEKDYASSIDDMFAQHLIVWNKAIVEKKKEIDALKSRVDIEKYNANLAALDEFKTQFLNTVKKSIQDYNRSKKELAESIIERDKAINDYLKKIDAKMLELTEFKNSFSKDVQDLLAVIPESESEKKARK